MSLKKLITSDKLESEESHEPVSFKETCSKYFKGPTNLLKTIVFLACSTGVVIQVVNCILKVKSPPITTFTHFNYNDTIQYPAVTFCKNPEYKHSALEKYNLYSHPRYTSTWMRFPFENTTLQEAWDEFVYQKEDVFVQVGFNGSPIYVNITPSLHFVNGKCYTITANRQVTDARMDTGYSVLLSHTQEDVDNCVSTFPPGYHMYIHSTVDPFTEFNIKENNLMEHLYVNVGEELEIKLSLSEYSKISVASSRCLNIDSYSAAKCGMKMQENNLANLVGCSGPWMNVDIEHCRNYSSMRRLIVAYLSDQESLGLSYRACPRRCHSHLYNAFVVSRKTLTVWDHKTKSWSKKTNSNVLQTQIYIFFNSMVVTIFQEHYNYDWSMFLADLGGTIGFLLGISVIGFIKMLGDMLFLLNPLLRSKSKQELKFNGAYMKQCRMFDPDEGNGKKSYNVYTNDYYI